MLSRRKILESFQPSPLSSLAVVSLSLMLTVAVIAVFMIKGIGLKQELVNLEHTSNAQQVLTLPGQAPPSETSNALQSTWPLAVFWGCMGLLAYFILSMFLGLFNAVYRFREELSFKNLSKSALITETLLNFIFKILVLTLWLIYLNFFLKKIVPFYIRVSHSVVHRHTAAEHLGLVILAFFTAALAIHLNVTMLRLVLGRTRVFPRS